MADMADVDKWRQFTKRKRFLPKVDSLSGYVIVFTPNFLLDHTCSSPLRLFWSFMDSIIYTWKQGICEMLGEEIYPW